MNHTYRLIWDEAQQAFVAVSEIARGRSKRSRAARLLAAASLALAGLSLQQAAVAQNVPSTALPTNGQVTSGAATIRQSGNTMTIEQATQKLVANWDSFNIGSGATVNFVQPNSASVALNRVTSANPSYIFGNLNANGQVYLVNPTGIVFGAGAQVNVGGLVASSLSLSDSDFLAGNAQFVNAGGAGNVSNAGTIQAASGGYVALIAPRVDNSGTLRTPQGTTLLAAADQVSLDFSGDRLIHYTVGQGALQAQASNNGVIQADDGRVVLTARAADALTQSVVNQNGLIQANSLVSTGGRVLLEGDQINLAAGSQTQATGATGGGEVLVGGGWQGSGGYRQATQVTMAQGASIDVRATQSGRGGTAVLWSDVTQAGSSTAVHGRIDAGGPGGGGQVETSGHALDVAGSSVNPGPGGRWLLDPVTLTVDATNSGTISATLSGGADVVLQTAAGSNGEIEVASSANIQKTGGGDATFKLMADRGIQIDSGAQIVSTVGKLNVILDAHAFNDAGLGGIRITNATIKTNGGDFVAGGGANPYVTPANETVFYNNTVDTVATGWAGVYINGTTNIITNGGDVYINGTGTTVDAATYPIGVRIDGPAVISTGVDANTGGAGSITIVGTAPATVVNSAPYIIGVDLGGTTLRTGSGNITITGKSNATTPGVWQAAIDMGGGGTNILATTTGNIVFNDLGGGIARGASNLVVTSTSGNITFNVSRTPFTGFGAGQLSVSSGGTLTIAPSIAGTTMGLGSGAGTINIAPGWFTGVGATQYFQSGFSNIVLGSPSAGDVTVGGSFASNTSLTVVSGGNLTINTGASLTTTGTSLTLAAGAGTARGIATGGNVINLGTIGSAGQVLLYSGSITGTTVGTIQSVSSLVPGSYRYDRQYQDAIGAPGIGDGAHYVLYREQPTLNVNLSSPSSKTQGTPDPTVTYSSVTGLQNGDTDAIASLSFSRQAGEAPGVYAYSGLSDIGYAVALNGAALTIVPSSPGPGAGSGPDHSQLGDTQAKQNTDDAFSHCVECSHVVSLDHADGPNGWLNLEPQNCQRDALTVYAWQAGRYVLQASYDLAQEQSAVRLRACEPILAASEKAPRRDVAHAERRFDFRDDDARLAFQAGASGSELTLDVADAARTPEGMPVPLEKLVRSAVGEARHLFGEPADAIRSVFVRTVE